MTFAQIGEQTITNIYDNTYALDAMKVDQPIKLVYVRNRQQRDDAYACGYEIAAPRCLRVGNSLVSTGSAVLAAGNAHVEVLALRFGDQPVERRIVEVAPPLFGRRAVAGLPFSRT